MWYLYQGCSVAVLHRARLENVLLQMSREKFKPADRVVIEKQLVHVKSEGFIVFDIDLVHPFVKFKSANARLFMAADAPGEVYVFCRDRGAIAPGCIKANGEGDRNALFALGRPLRHREPVFDGRYWVHSMQIKFHFGSCTVNGRRVADKM